MRKAATKKGPSLGQPAHQRSTPASSVENLLRRSPPKSPTPPPQRASARPQRAATFAANASADEHAAPRPAPRPAPTAHYESARVNLCLPVWERASSTRSPTIYSSHEDVRPTQAARQRHADQTPAQQRPSPRAQISVDDYSSMSDATLSSADSQESACGGKKRVLKKRAHKKMPPIPKPDTPAGVRRRHSPEEEADAAKRACAAGSMQPSTFLSPWAARSVAEALQTHRASPPPHPAPPASCSPPSPRSYADAAAEQRPSTPESAIQRAPPASNQQPVAAQKIPRPPPIVVEKLPDWPRHLQEIRKLLGRVANARPFGRGIRFLPEDEVEYRCIQRYMTDLSARDSTVEWFSYALPATTSLKVAIRGLPVDTPIDLLTEEFFDLGFQPEFIREIRARGERPGCILFGMFARSPNISDIYNVKELLACPGVVIEGWRGRRRPAQCHRCQLFRHSSHHCHRPLVCVRCGGDHAAKQCPRPRAVPATCANCGGPHPANFAGCPTIRREARNKWASSVSSTKRRSARHGPSDALHPVEVTADPAAPSLMAAANPATQRDAIQPKRNRRRKKKKSAAPGSSLQRTDPHVDPASAAAVASAKQNPQTKKTPPVAAPNGAAASAPIGASDILTTVLGILQQILQALATGRPSEEVILTTTKGIADVLALAAPPASTPMLPPTAAVS